MGHKKIFIVKSLILFLQTNYMKKKTQTNDGYSEVPVSPQD